MTPTDKLVSRAVELAAEFNENFLELARTLRELHDLSGDAFQHAVSQARLGQRKARYLVTIDRVFGPLPISKSRLRKIGWSKLSAIASYVSKDNWIDLLHLAEQHTAAELKAIVRGEDPEGKRRSVLLYLNSDDYQAFETILLQFGAERSRRGLLGRESALMEMAWWAQHQLEMYLENESEGSPDDGPPYYAIDDEMSNAEIDAAEMSDFDAVMSTQPKFLRSLLARVQNERDALKAEVEWLKSLVTQIIERHRARLKELGFRETVVPDATAENENDPGRPEG